MPRRSAPACASCSWLFPWRVAESAAESRLDLWARRLVVLRTALRDFDRSHDRAKAADRRPVPAVREAEQQCRPVGVPAAGRINHGLGCNARYLMTLTAGEDERALRAQGADQGLDRFGNVLELAAGLFLEHLAFIVIDGDVRCPL